MAKDEVTLTILGDIPLAYRTEELRGIKGTAWENFTFKHVKSGDKAPTPNDLVDVFARHAIKGSEKLGIPLADFFKTVNPNPNISSAHVTMRENKKRGDLVAYMAVNEQGRSGSVKMYASHSDSITGGTTVVNPSTAPHVGDMAGGGEGRGGGKKGRGTAPSVSDKVKNQHLLMYGTPSPSVLKSQEYRNFIEKNYGPRAVDFPSSFLSGSGMSVREFRAMTANEFLMQGTSRGSIQYTGKQNRQMDHNNRFAPFDAVAYKAALEEKERALKNSINRHTPIKDNSPSVSDFRFKESQFVSTNPGRHGPDATREQIYPKAANAIFRQPGSRATVETIQGDIRARTSPASVRHSNGMIGGRGELLSDTGPMGGGASFEESKPVRFDARHYGSKEIREGGTLYSSRSWGIREIEKGSNLIKETVELLRSKPTEGSVADTIQKVSGKRGGGGKSDLLGGASSDSSGTASSVGSKGARGLGQHIAEQVRHAAIWQAYTPVMAAVGAVASAPLIPFNTRAAGELVGIGASRKEQLAALQIHGSSNALDSFRRTDEAIMSSKKLMSAIGWAPSVENQIKASMLGNTVHFVSKAADIESEPLTQISVRTAQMFGSKKLGEQAHIEKILGALYKSGAMTSVKGPELAQTLSQGGAAFASLFGEEGAGKAIAYSVPFIQAGVPNVGRAIQHQMSGEVQDKMARSQLLAEINYANMEKYGDNTKYAIGEDHLNNLLGFKTVNKQRVPKNPELQQRLQAIKQQFAEQLQDPLSNYALHAKYGHQLEWGLKYGVKVPKTDQVHARFSSAAMNLMSPSQIDSTLGTYNTTLEGFTNNSAVVDAGKAEGIKNAASDSQAAWTDIKDFSSDNAFFNSIFGFARGITTAHKLTSQMKDAVDKDEDPRARLYKAVLDIKDQMNQGHVSDGFFSILRADEQSPEGYANAILKIHRPKDYERFKITGKVDKPFEDPGYDPSAQGDGWRGGDPEYNFSDSSVTESEWMRSQKRDAALLDARRRGVSVGKFSSYIDHTKNVDPYEMQYMNMGSGVNEGYNNLPQFNSFDSPGAISSPGGDYGGAIVEAIGNLGKIITQTFTNLPAPAVNVTVTSDGNKKAEATSTTDKGFLNEAPF